MKKLLAQVDIGDAYKLGSEGIGEKPGYSSIGELISKILPNIFVVAGLLLFIFALAGGFVIITSGGSSEKNKQGTGLITAAVIGFVLIFGSYWLIQIIQHLTGINILNPSVN